jgi:hypothetical protein
MHKERAYATESCGAPVAERLICGQIAAMAPNLLA